MRTSVQIIQLSIGISASVQRFDPHEFTYSQFIYFMFHNLHYNTVRVTSETDSQYQQLIYFKVLVRSIKQVGIPT